MKIILLVPFVGKNPLNDIENCQTRFHVFAYFLYKYLSRYDYINVELHSCPQRGKTFLHQKLIQNFIVPTGDHLILIDEGGFYTRPKEFKIKIRTKIRGAICSIGVSNVYLGEEDMMFFVIPFGLQKRKNTMCLGWLSDNEILNSKKQDNIINILINYNPAQQTNNKNIVDDIYEFVRSNRKKGSTITMKQLLQGGTKVLELSRKIEESGKTEYFTNYKDKYDLYSDTNIFFIFDKNINKLDLIEMTMANIIIIAPVGYIDDRLIEMLEIITYDDKLDWIEITNKLKNHNPRNKLLCDDCTWDKGVYKIVDFLSNFKLDKKDYDAERMIQNEKEVQRKKETINKVTNKVTNKISHERDKKPTLFQSQFYFK